MATSVLLRFHFRIRWSCWHFSNTLTLLDTLHVSNPNTGKLNLHLSQDFIGEYTGKRHNNKCLRQSGLVAEIRWEIGIAIRVQCELSLHLTYLRVTTESLNTVMPESSKCSLGFQMETNPPVVDLIQPGPTALARHR
jgi:hypothetical protein